MTGLLAELTVATSIAVAVLGTAAYVSQREHAGHARLLERAVANQTAEAVLVHAGSVPVGAGTHEFDMAKNLPHGARLPGVSVVFEVTPEGTDLAHVVVTVRWNSRSGEDTVVLRGTVELAR